MLRARETILNLPIYHPPLDGRSGMRLDFNENVDGCSPCVLDVLRNLTREQIATYPERKPLEQIVARHFGAKSEELLLTNGADEAIHLLCETFISPGDEVLISVPTFSMYEIYAAATGAQVNKIPAGRDFAFPMESMLKHVTNRTRLIAIANPNNPTGTIVSREDLLEIAANAPHAAILIDEAYCEFSKQTLLPRWREFTNLFVARTFSKAYGLAGLRLGFLAGDPKQIDMVRKVASPYNVNAIALACLPAALADHDYVRDYTRQVCQGRQLLQQALRELQIEFWPSHANFVLIRLGEFRKAFIEGMRSRGILVRDRSSDFGCEGCVRISLGTLDQTTQMLTALRETVERIGMNSVSRT